MKRILLITIIAATAILHTGCGSLVSRVGHEWSGNNCKLGVYPGVRADAWIVVTTPVRTFRGEPSALLAAPWFAADLPLSTIADTCLLPHDLSKAK